jgi:hypothetical protein
MLLVFIVETANAGDAQTLLRLSQVTEGRDHCMVGVAAGSLFSLVVARSIFEGVEAFETQDALARFEPGLARILARYAS